MFDFPLRSFDILAQVSISDQASPVEVGSIREHAPDQAITPSFWTRDVHFGIHPPRD